MIYLSGLLLLHWLVSTEAFSPVLQSKRDFRERPHIHRYENGGAYLPIATAPPSLSSTAQYLHHGSASMLSEIATEYGFLLEHHPLVTASLTAGFLSGLGDVIAQLQERKAHHDMARTQRFVLKGLGGGLIWLGWYHLADAISDQWLPDVHDVTGAIERTVLSILLDQFLASPLIIAAWEIPVPILLTPQEDNALIPGQVQSKLGGLLVENAKIWTIANMVIYNLPFQYRVLASSLTDVLWQSILSSHVNVGVDVLAGEGSVSSLPLLELVEEELALKPEPEMGRRGSLQPQPEMAQ